MKFKFDPGNEYDSPGSTLDEGVHLLRVKSCATTKSKTGNPMLDIVLVAADKSTSNAGREMRAWYMLVETDAAKWYLRRFCHALDERMRETGSGFDALSQASCDEWITGKYVACRIYHEDDEYQGKTYKRPRLAKKDVRALTAEESQLMREQHGEGDSDSFDEDEIPF